jgi:hypothetical protein
MLPEKREYLFPPDIMRGRHGGLEGVIGIRVWDHAWPFARIEIGYLWLVYAEGAFGANLLRVRRGFPMINTV